MRDRLRIGITIGLGSEGETLWNNGIKQNAVFLAEALKRCPGVGRVCLVNTTHIPLTSALPWDRERWPTLSFEEAKDDLDVLIELGGQISSQQTDYIKARGTRLVSYCCGSEYVHTTESVLFGTRAVSSDLFVNQRFDAIWMIPQVANISQGYFTVLRRRPAEVVPFVWDPMFITERCAQYLQGGEYRPREGPRRLTVMEPNINVVKFCLYPVFIAELAFRSRPELVSFLHVTNAEHLAKQSKEFVAIMTKLDIVQQHKASFVGRFETPQFLSEMTDVVISHQWENPLNYFYLEVCWQGYPLVHNAHLVSDLGYYYPGHDIDVGASQLLHALQAHDANWDRYRDAQRRLIERFQPSNERVTSRYDELLHGLLQQPVI
ncbi:MAG: hypothetical protein K0Q43_3190 [Ramlibacter sp.]|nr:hypothetical protein [Ramlibacter sp.]